jgi:hypothetical protein
VTSFEDFATRVWRATGKRALPPNTAEAIRRPTKRVLRKLGLFARRDKKS